jgi:hypothetical protein
VIAHTIRVRKAIGGINMTASHNPAEYQGLKFSTIRELPHLKTSPGKSKKTSRNSRKKGGPGKAVMRDPSNVKP